MICWSGLDVVFAKVTLPRSDRRFDYLKNSEERVCEKDTWPIVTDSFRRICR